jgi:hypothetical protein
MGECLCLADMLYSAVISLAVAPQQSRFRFLQRSKFIKYVQLKKLYLNQHQRGKRTIENCI